MPRIALILSLLAFVMFNCVQYLGWSLFTESVSAQAVRSAGAARVFHK